MSWATSDYPYGSLSWLRKEVAAVMPDFPKDIALLDNNQRQIIDSIIDGGLFRFYQPAPTEFTVPDATEAQKERLKRAPHNWSFLSTYLDIAMVAGQTEYSLPSNFNSLVAEPTTAGRTEDHGKLAIANESQLRQLIGEEASQGYPLYCAKRVIVGDGTTQTANKLVVYPIPVQAETITLQYSIVPQRLTDDAPWPVSGTEHAQTVLACCLAVMEERSGTGATDYRTKEANMLASSIMLDAESAQASAEGVWPTDTDETLLTTKEKVWKRIGVHLGFGPNYKAWSASQLAKVKEIFKEGLRLFCNPPIIPGMTYPHQWGFLRPKASLSTVASQTTYDLPVDLAAVEGPMVFKPSSHMVWPAARQVGEWQIREKLQRSNLTGRPREFAVRVKAATADPQYKGQTTYEVIFYPTPDAVYELEYRYTVSMNV